MRGVVILFLAAGLGYAGAGNAAAAELPTTIPSTQPGEPPRTGEFEMVLRDRSPLSAQSELVRRFGKSLKDMGPDYDPHHHQFILRVPDDYSPDHPMGLVMYANQNDNVNRVAPPICSILDEKHLIFAVPIVPERAIWKEGGLALDLVYNVGKAYSLDMRRIYIISWHHGSEVGMGDADIYTGSASLWDYGWWDKLIIGASSYWKPYQSKPADGMLMRAARERPFLLMPHPTVSIDYRWAVDKAMREDGFKHVKTRPTPIEDFHWENVKPECFQEIIDFLDGVTQAKEEAATQASAPQAIQAKRAAEAQSLLSLARSYEGAGRGDLARQKLAKIGDKYPDTPAAIEAAQMLKQMDQP
jgi:hypothetical protein